MFALAFSLLFVNRKWGGCLFNYCSNKRIVARCRGVHFPFDILGGILVGLLSAILVRWLFVFLFKKAKIRMTAAITASPLLNKKVF